MIVVKLTWPRQELDQITPADDIESAAQQSNMEANGKMVAPTCHSFLEKKYRKIVKKLKFSNYLLGEYQIIFLLDRSIHQRLI